MIRKRYVGQWHPVAGDHDEKCKTWTEVTLTVEDLAVMVGCASDSLLIGFFVDIGSNITMTFNERREPECSTRSYPESPGQQPGPSVPSS